MFEKTKPTRDPFAFSLRGMTTIAAFTIAPAIADDRINKIRDERLGQSQSNKPGVARQIEDFLASYFAPGRRHTATHCE